MGLQMSFDENAGGIGSENERIDPVTGKVTNSPEAMHFWRPEFRKEYDIPEIG